MANYPGAALLEGEGPGPESVPCWPVPTQLALSQPGSPLPLRYRRTLSQRSCTRRLRAGREWGALWQRKEQSGVAGRELRARGGTAARGLLGVDHPERSGRRGGFYPKMPPKVEAITMPRTTQQMTIMIFFCTGRHREASESAEAGGREGG